MDICEVEAQVRHPAGVLGKPHLKKACSSMIIVWEELTGERFKRTFEDVPSVQEFVAAGPRFIHTVLREIDPELKFSAIKAALKTVEKRSE